MTKGDNSSDGDALGAVVELDELPNYASGPPVAHDSRRLLAEACLRAAIPSQVVRNANKSRSIVLIEVPSSEWLSETRHAASRIWNASDVLSLEASARRKESELNPFVKLHTGGRGMVIVSDDLDRTVPKSIRYAALHRVGVSGPDKATYLSVARRLLVGHVGRAFADVDIAGLDYVTLCVCLVRGDTAKSAAGKVRLAGERARASLDSTGVPPLSDVHGYEEARKWASDLRLDLEDFVARRLPWSQVDHGALLWGPPGTGKSLFARIVAKDCRIPVITASIADYFTVGSGHLDSVIKEQRAIFRRAMELSPCLLFIDELDALPARSADSQHQDFWRPVINDFLMLLDSAMADREGVVVLGATNRIADLDPAILRPGRMDRLLHIPPPDPEALVGILRYYLQGELEDEDLIPIVRASQGSTGADAVAWVKAARRAARADKRSLQLKDLEGQIVGQELRGPSLLKRIAVHEVGHALAAVVAGIPVNCVTIISGENNGGITRVDTPKQIASKTDLELHVVTMLAGRAAEAVMLGVEPTTGAGGGSSSDLAQATNWVKAMHTNYAMGDTLAWRDLSEPAGQSFGMDTILARVVEADLRRLYNVAVGMIVTHQDAAWAMVDLLLREKVLDGPAVIRIFEAASA